MRRAMCFDDEIPLPAPKPTPKPTPKPRPTTSARYGETYVVANGLRVVDVSTFSWRHEFVDVTSFVDQHHTTEHVASSLSLTGYLLDSWTDEEHWPDTVTLHRGSVAREMRVRSCHIEAPTCGAVMVHMEMVGR